MVNEHIKSFNEQLAETITLLERQEQILTNLVNKKDQVANDLSNDVPNFMLQRK